MLKIFIILLQERNGFEVSRGGPVDIQQRERCHESRASHTTDEDDEGTHTLHLQATRKLQEHLRRFVGTSF